MVAEENRAEVAPSETSQLPAPNSLRRLLSLDALRGFNMFWIMGGDDLLSSISKHYDHPALSKVADIFCHHVAWEGFRYHDMIFPLFLFIIGVSLPMSTASRFEKGDTRGQVARKVIQRTLFLIALAYFYYGVLELKGWEHQRMMGVLQRLALGYGVAGLIMLYTDVKGQARAAIGLLVGYWLVMRFVPVPGYGSANYTEWGNFANYMDRIMFLPGQNYEKYGDPEGLFSTIPAIATALMGVLAGQWLRRTDRDGPAKAKMLIIAGVLCIAAGYLWSIDFPIIKKIWTSSYVLVAGGWSLLLLGAFYWVIDVKGWKKWTYAFVVIGLNPITIYVGDRFIDFDAAAMFFTKGVLKHTGSFTVIVTAASIVLVRWLFLNFLHRHKIYFRV